MAPDGNMVQTIRIDYASDINIKAFALDINIEEGPAFQRIRDFKTGESNAVSPGYGIFPSRFRDFIVVTGPNWVDVNYNPTTAVCPRKFRTRSTRRFRVLERQSGK